MFNKNSSALICDDSDSMNRIKDILEKANIKVFCPENRDDAIERLRFTPFDIVLLDEKYDKGVFDYLQNMTMPLRRNIFLILLSDELKTDSGLSAFSKSVDLILNRKDINDISEILKKALSEKDRFYTIYQETLTKIGKK